MHARSKARNFPKTQPYNDTCVTACRDTYVCIKVHEMTKSRCNRTYHIDSNKYVVTTNVYNT
jgi:hypothetical protein